MQKEDGAKDFLPDEQNADALNSDSGGNAAAVPALPAVPAVIRLWGR